MAYFDCIVGGSGKSEKGNTLVVTCADDLARATITCTDGTKTYRKTCPSTAPYEVTFYGLEAGTWTVSTTVSGSIYTATVVITDYEAELGGFSWRAWVDLSQNYTSSDFTDLDDLLSDETAVRELMIIHDCVDYLAGIAAESADVETIIGNDLCAKWINLSDYALDTLSANPVIKAFMDVSRKELKGQVPKMTSNTTPSGEVIYSTQYSSSAGQAFIAFDKQANASWITTEGSTTNQFIGYIFDEPVCVKMVMLHPTYGSDNHLAVKNWKIQARNSTSDEWVTLKEGMFQDTNVGEQYIPLDNDTEYRQYRAFIVDIYNASYVMVIELQFYAYEYSSKYFLGEWTLMPQVPTMTSNTAPYGEASASSVQQTATPAYNAFTGSDSNLWASTTTDVTNAWIQYKFIEPVIVKRISLKTVYAGGHLRFGDFNIQGSNDGFVSDVHTLGERITIADTSQVDYTFDVDNDTAYQYYRLSGITSKGADIEIKILQFYAWQPKGNVPVMTSNTAPYGEASASSVYSGNPAYYAFDGNYSTMWEDNAEVSGRTANVVYHFTNPICPKKVSFTLVSPHIQAIADNYVIIGSNDGTNYTPLLTISSSNINVNEEYVANIENDTYYMYLGMQYLKKTNSTPNVRSLQFYGRELSDLVPTMFTNTTPKGEAFADSAYSSSYPAYEAFDKNITDAGQAWHSAPQSTPTGHWIGYEFEDPTIITKAVLVRDGRWSTAYTLRGHLFLQAYDGNNWVNLVSDITFNGGSLGSFISVDIPTPSAYSKYRFYTPQGYLSTDGKYYFTAEEVFLFGPDYSEKEFEEGTTKKWLYDHGVELETLDETKTNTSCIVDKKPSSVAFEVPATAQTMAALYATLDLTPYNLFRGFVGEISYANTTTSGMETGFAIVCNAHSVVNLGSAIARSGVTQPMNGTPYTAMSLDVSSFNEEKSVGVCTANGTGTIVRKIELKEFWLE